MLHRSHLFAAVALLLSLGAACTQSEDDACGKGNVYDDGVCRAAPAAASGKSSSSDGGAPPSNEGGAANSEAGDSGAQPAQLPPGFGEDCHLAPDCGGDTNYCVPQSPVDTQYCTVSGCDAVPDLCPEGWTCFDLSQFVPGEPWVCSRPIK